MRNKPSRFHKRIAMHPSNSSGRHIPPDVSHWIARLLPLPDIGRLFMTSKYLYNLENKPIFLDAIKREFPQFAADLTELEPIFSYKEKGNLMTSFLNLVYGRGAKAKVTHLSKIYLAHPNLAISLAKYLAKLNAVAYDPILSIMIKIITETQPKITDFSLIKDNRDIMLILVRKNKDSYNSASDRLKLDPDIAVALVQQVGWDLFRVPEILAQTDPDVYGEIALAAVNQRGDALKHVPATFAETHLESYRKIALATRKQN